ncbi:MAG TPA: glycerol-3-phosphate dehydrogenase/oxidase [Thermoanaerobaculia bacterium]|nr:glycerol-3-phosphate dehydrogenase/oxidase [Thermoanaerobaculia bacterium]
MDVRVAVAGGGINGAGVAWELARKGYDVSLFERGEFGGETSSATTKLIHGGLRYLEHLQFGLVHESLRERAFLLERLPSLVKPIEIIIPWYGTSPRPFWVVQSGLVLYDALAGGKGLGRHRVITRDEVLRSVSIRAEGLRGGFLFSDGQTDDRELVQTVIRSAERDGVRLCERTAVESVRPVDDGWVVVTGGSEQRFDLLVVVLGPWMNEFLERNRIATAVRLSLIRGSHLVLRRRMGERGVLLQSADDRRVLFALPWKGKTMVGTTEVEQNDLGRIEPSEEEIDYLIRRFNRYFDVPATRDEIVETFAGVRPLIGRKRDPRAISRDSTIEAEGRLVKVFGGKMTTFLALARRVGRRADRLLGESRTARPPQFDTSR